MSPISKFCHQHPKIVTRIKSPTSTCFHHLCVQSVNFVTTGMDQLTASFISSSKTEFHGLFQGNIAYTNDQSRTTRPHMTKRFTIHTWPLPACVSLIYPKIYFMIYLLTFELINCVIGNSNSLEI